MFTKFILYITCISNLCLRSEYERKIEDESRYDDSILKEVKGKMLNKDTLIYDSLKKCHVSCYNTCKDYTKGKILLNLLNSYYRILAHILHYILEKKTDPHLIKLILNIKPNKDKNMSNYLVSSVYSTLLIQNLIIVSSSNQEIEENIDDLVNFLRDKLDENSFLKEIYENDILVQRSKIYNVTWFNLIFFHFLTIFKRYNLLLADFSKYLCTDNLYQVERSLDVPSFRTRYFEIINKVINRFTNVPNDTFYVLFNHKGFKYNRITNSRMIELYINNRYRTFMKYDNFYATDLENNDVDIFYLHGKVFNLYTKEFFEYIMGLLQYVSCSYKKHIICSYKKNSLELEILNTDDVPLEMILDYYKSKNDLTNKIIEEPDIYSNKYFVSIVEGKEYRFTKQDGDIKVNSKCLLLNCSHILGNELLIEYFSNLLTRCHLCNAEFKVIGYFEVDLFTNL